MNEKLEDDKHSSRRSKRYKKNLGQNQRVYFSKRCAPTLIVQKKRYSSKLILYLAIFYQDPAMNLRCRYIAFLVNVTFCSTLVVD